MTVRSAHASDLQEAAQQAVRIGDYDFALQAFEQAYAASPSEDLLLAVARTHRSMRALGKTRGPAATRLAVLSPIMGARVRIDGGKALRLPVFVELSSGPHVIVVSAKGHAKRKRTVRLRPERAHAVFVSLEPLPAKLALETASEAEIHVDGTFVGVAPLEEPLDLEPGPREIVVTHTGYEPARRQLVLERGKTQEVEVELERTDQRIAAALLLSGGAASLATGVTMGVLALLDHREARDIGDSAPEYPALIDRRDDYRLVSTVTAGVGLGLLLVGGALFILDEPLREESGEPPKPGDVSFTGDAITVRF